MTKATTKTGRKMGWNATVEADFFGNKYLGDANEAAERGQDAKADRLLAKGQFWLDRYNSLTGNGA